jgi:hypothetical protein
MTNAWRAQTTATILSLFVLAGCSSTQPDSIDTRVSSLSFRASALVEIYDCYEEWQDTTGPNGVPDGTPDVKISDSLVCFPALDDNGFPIRTQRAVPWRYTIAVTTVRAGNVAEELITSVNGEIGLNVTFGSLTDYDVATSPAPLQTINPPGTDIYYRFGTRMSTGNPIYLNNLGVDPGVPNILNVTPTFDFNLNSGDTVIVRVRKQAAAQAVPDSPPYPDLTLSGNLTVSGVVVTPVSTPEGNPPTSTTDDEAGITFSFTVQ